MFWVNVTYTFFWLFEIFVLYTLTCRKNIVKWHFIEGCIVSCIYESLLNSMSRQLAIPECISNRNCELYLMFIKRSALGYINMELKLYSSQIKLSILTLVDYHLVITIRFYRMLILQCYVGELFSKNFLDFFFYYMWTGLD